MSREADPTPKRAGLNSIGTFAAQAPQRPEHDLQVQPQARLSRVAQVQVQALTVTAAGSDQRLRQPRNSWPHATALSPIRVGVERSLYRNVRPWADQAHVADHNIPQLWQFIDARYADQSAHPRDARVPRFGEVGSDGVCVFHHTAKLEHAKFPSSKPYSGLSVQYRETIFQGDGHNRDEHQWRERYGCQ